MIIPRTVDQEPAGTPYAEHGEDNNDRSNGQARETTFSSSEKGGSSGVDAQNPWPGLAPFTEELKKFFHGRADEADEMLRRIGRKDLTVLFGQSGLGKSSLLQAGVFPRLRVEGYLPVPIRLDHAATAPPLPDQVKAAVTRAVVASGGRVEYSDAVASDTLWEHFHRRGLCLQTPKGERVSLVLVLDQFEELFAIGQASEETRARAARFLTEWADLIENRVPKALEEQLEESPELARQFTLDDRGYRALICLREDYLPHLESLRPTMPSIAENRMRLTRMNGLRALEAVLEPGGGLVAAEVGRQIVRFVAGGQLRQAMLAPSESEDEELARLEVEPSLLSLVCRELNNRRVALELPQITADLLAGNRERILQDYYERCFADQPSAVRIFVEDELVTDSGLRENIALERARKTLIQRGALPTAIDELVKRRLLHIEDRLDIQRVELTHDVLTVVVKKSRDQRQQHEATLRAEQQAQEVREKARRQRRRLRLIVAGMAVALLVVGGFGVASYRLYRVSAERLREVERQKEEARQAREDAVREKERAEESQRLAGQRFDEKRQAMDNVMAQFSDAQLNGQPGTQKIRRVLFQRGVEQYQAMLKDNRDDPTVALKLADLNRKLGLLQSDIESLDQALVPLRKGEAVLRKLAEANPDNRDYRYQLAALLTDMGQCCQRHRNKGVGIPALREAKDILTKLLEPEPERFEYRLTLGTAQMRLALLFSDAERDAEHRLADDVLRKLVADYPKEPRALDALARNTLNRGFRAVDVNRFADAEGLFQKALELAQLILSINPSDQDGYIDLHYALNGQAQVYGKTDRVAKGLEVLKKAVDDLTQLAAANPDVFFHQQSLVWAHDDLRKLYQRAGDYEKAVASLQEIIRIADALAQRDPQNELHASDAIDAVISIAGIYRNTKREAEAAAVLDKALKQADQMMRLHPTSNTVLGRLLHAFQIRGDLSQNVQQYEPAVAAFQHAVDLYNRHRPTVNGLTEWTSNKYLQCCRGLLQIAKDQKQTRRALEIATKQIAPINPDTFKESDYKQTLLEMFITLSQLHEDTGNVKEAIRWRVLAVEESRKGLGGNPKSNWYLYQQVYGAHRHLARLYKKDGDEKREFEAIRDFLKEEEPYVREHDHSALLAQSASFTPKNLNKLREAFEQFSTSGTMKRFTVPTDFEGVKYSFHIYVADSWQFFDDQITWVERVRGGKFPKDARDAFQRLYKIAKDNKVSFPELCVYALGSVKVDPTKAGSESPVVLERTVTNVDSILKELAVARQELQSGKGGAEARKRLAFRYARLAAEDIADANFFRARNWLGDARNYLEIDSLDRPRDSADADVFAYLKFVEAALLSATGEFQKGYAQLAEGLQTGFTVIPVEFAVPAGAREFALGWTSHKLKRPVEAMAWYRKALELRHKAAAGRLFLLAQEFPESRYALPGELRQLMDRAKIEATEKQTALAVFIRLTGSSAEDPATVRKRNEEQIATARKLAVQCHDQVVKHEAAGQVDKAREALEQEFGFLFEVFKLEPSDLDKLNVMAEMSAIALKVARFYTSAKDTKSEVKWTVTAGDLANADALFHLADWHEKGVKVAQDPAKAAQYRLRGYRSRAVFALKDRRYDAALPDLQKALDIKGANAEDHNNLGMCYGKLGRWDEAIKAYTHSVELDLKSENATSVILNLLEALTVAERPDQLLQFVQTVEKKGWKLSKEGAQATKYNALFHGFRAIALRMTGKDASDAERQMRQFTGQSGFKMTGWTWNELDGWLKKTKLAADRKATVQQILAELKGTKSP